MSNPADLSNVDLARLMAAEAKQGATYSYTALHVMGDVALAEFVRGLEERGWSLELRGGDSAPGSFPKVYYEVR